MKTLKFPDGTEVAYELVRKPVKNVNVRMEDDGTLRVSANSRISVAEIERFILSQQNFVTRARKRLGERAAMQNSREKIHWLGREYPVRVISNGRECALLEGDEVRVFTRFPDEEHVERLVMRWLVESFTKLCGELNAEVLEKLHAAGLKPPPTIITIKDMESRWGSCSWTRGHISINFRLSAYPRQTVLSVFWHEYAHYWHHDHSKRFYAFLDEHFPEYRKWNSLLK